MSRKNQTTIPTQFKHLRFYDSENQQILNMGGYTLAYRLRYFKAENVAEIGRIEVGYAFSECQITENFNKELGRRITYHRLNGQPENYYDAFDLSSLLPDGWERHLIHLNGENAEEDIVDIRLDELGMEHDPARYVIRHFLENWASMLYVGSADEGEGNMLQNLVELENSLAIDSSVLEYVAPTMETLAQEVSGTIIEIADGAITKIDELDTTQATLNAIPELRKALVDIKDLMLALTASEDEEESDEEESDDEEEEESDEEESDDEESDEEEGDEEKN